MERCIWLSNGVERSTERTKNKCVSTSSKTLGNRIPVCCRPCHRLGLREFGLVWCGGRIRRPFIRYRSAPALVSTDALTRLLNTKNNKQNNYCFQLKKKQTFGMTNKRLPNI